MKHAIYRDPTYWYLIINCALVIVGYALAIQTGKDSLPWMFIIKNIILILSIFHLVFYRISFLASILKTAQEIAVLSILIIASSLLTSDAISSLFRALAFIIPLMYVAISVIYLMYAYEIKYVTNALIDGTNWIYLIPVISFFLTGGSLNDTNIYYISGENEASVFVSNHYGWASTIFLVTGIDLIRNKFMTRWRKILIITFCPIAVYLILISGNRTSWLCLAVVLVLFILNFKGLNITSKAFLSLIPLFIVAYLLTDPKSAVNSRLEKSKVQEKKGEARMKQAGRILEYFNNNPSTYITGIGMFNSKKLNSLIGWSGYHNSYFEVLFGAGIPIFLFFLSIFLIRPIWNFMFYFSEHYLFLPPFLIIPYFESNLTGGQFLFFPWFMAVILMSYSMKIAALKMKIGLG